MVYKYFKVQSTFQSIQKWITGLEEMWRNRTPAFWFFILPLISSISICKLCKHPCISVSLKKFLYLKIITKKNPLRFGELSLTYRKVAGIIEEKTCIPFIQIHYGLVPLNIFQCI